MFGAYLFKIYPSIRTFSIGFAVKTEKIRSLKAKKSFTPNEIINI